MREAIGRIQTISDAFIRSGRRNYGPVQVERIGGSSSADLLATKVRFTEFSYPEFNIVIYNENETGRAKN